MWGACRGAARVHSACLCVGSGSRHVMCRFWNDGVPHCGSCMLCVGGEGDLWRAGLFKASSAQMKSSEVSGEELRRRARAEG